MNNQFHILLAEDDENDVFLLQRAFAQAEIKNLLHIAHNGEEAIDCLAGNGKFADRLKFPLPGLVILDLKMPKKNGIDVLKWLREQPGMGCLPVIVLSSSPHPHDIERAYRLGANAFVVKPSSNEERSLLARYIKGFWLLFNQPPLVCTQGIEAARKAHAEVEALRNLP